MRPTSLRTHCRKAVSEVSLPGSYHSSPSADDPNRIFASRRFQWQLSESSSHTDRLPSDRMSASADLGPLARLGRQCAGYLTLARKSMLNGRYPLSLRPDSTLDRRSNNPRLLGRIQSEVCTVKPMLPVSYCHSTDRTLASLSGVFCDPDT